MAKSTTKQPASARLTETRDDKSLPANYPIAFLYQSSGIYYYASHCCDCGDPHWGIILSNEEIDDLGCPAMGDGAGETYDQIVANQLDFGLDIPWFASATDDLQLTTSSVIAHDEGFVDILSDAERWIFDTANKHLKNRIFDVVFLRTSVGDPCGGDDPSSGVIHSYIFGLAKLVSSSSPVEHLVKLDETIYWDETNLTTGDYIVLTTGIHYDGMFVPLLIVSKID
jgi:hypothetical protein